MLIKWSPLDELTKFEKSMKSVFDLYSWKPDTNIYEDKEKISLEMEIPGVKLKDISITVDNNYLTIKGEKKVFEKNKDKEYFKIERNDGIFVRTFSLPNNVNVDKINALYENGVLVVDVFKKLESIVKSVEIKGSS